MKKIRVLLIVLSITTWTHSQEAMSKKEKIVALLEMNNNSKFFTDLVALNIQKIDKEKQTNFRQEIAVLANSTKEKAVAFFNKKYSDKDIQVIYDDYAVPNRMVYSQKTLSFLREWKTHKRDFQKDFKKIFAKY